MGFGDETNVVRKIGQAWARQRGRNETLLAMRNDVRPDTRLVGLWDFGGDAVNDVSLAIRD